MWESYIRDLAVFGANAIELIPPRSDDAADSPHFPLPPMEMMVEMSRLAQEYGLECWIWYPAMDPDYSNAATVAAALKEWGEVFRRLPRIDAVFVPGGDPGHTEPRYLMALLEKQTANLQEVSSEGDDVGLSARLQRAVDGAVLRTDGPAAAVAQRHRIRAAGARQPARVAAAHPEAIPDPLLSGHHALGERGVRGERLGRGVCADRGARRHQSAAAGRGADFPRAAAVRRRGFPDVLGRLQRRRQQGGVERAGMESGCQRDRRAARLRAVFYRTGHGGCVRAGTARAGAQLARSAARRTPRWR